MKALKKAIAQAVAEGAQGIIARYDTDALRMKLLEMPRLIRGQKSVVNDMRLNMKDTEDAMNQEESILVSMIATEIDPKTNKAMFTNKESRDAELCIRKKNSKVYKIALTDFAVAETNLNEATYALEQLQDEFKSLRIVSRIVCKELALLGLDDEEEDDNDCY